MPPHLAAEVGLGGGSGLPLEVGAPHDDLAGIALNRRYGLEGKGAAISAGVLTSAAHAAFGVVGYVLLPISAAASTIARRVAANGSVW